MKIMLPIMIICTGCFAGFYIKNAYIKRQNILKLYIKVFNTLLLHIKSENLSTYNLIKLIALDTRFEQCTIFTECYKSLQNTDDFPKSYGEAVNKCLTLTSLLPQDIEIISELKNILGFYDLSHVISQLELLLQKLQDEFDDAVIQTSSQGKVYQTLTSLGSVAIAIIII